MQNTYSNFNHSSSKCQAPTTKPLRVVSGGNIPGTKKLFKKRAKALVALFLSGEISPYALAILNEYFFSIAMSGGRHNGTWASDYRISLLCFMNGIKSRRRNCSEKEAIRDKSHIPYSREHTNKTKNSVLKANEIISVAKQRSSDESCFTTLNPLLRADYVVDKLKYILNNIVFFGKRNQFTLLRRPLTLVSANNEKEQFLRLLKKENGKKGIKIALQVIQRVLLPEKLMDKSVCMLQFVEKIIEKLNDPQIQKKKVPLKKKRENDIDRTVCVCNTNTSSLLSVIFKI